MAQSNNASLNDGIHDQGRDVKSIIQQSRPDPPRPKKIAFLNAGGKVIDRDHVACLHYNDPKKLVDTDINIGDTFVFEATLRLVDYDQAVFVDLSKENFDRSIEELNSCSVAVLRGSNYIHANMQWGQLGAAIEQSRVPIVAFGIGAQAPRYENISVSRETERVLKTISERSHSVGCRGHFTAETLEKLGIQNAVPIGCPSLFRRNDPLLQVRMPALDSIRRVAFTIARGISGMYCDDSHAARKKQIQAIEELSRRHELYLITQSEKSEKLFYFRIYERIEEAKSLMRSSAWDLAKMPWLEELYWSRIFFGNSPRRI